MGGSFMLGNGVKISRIFGSMMKNLWNSGEKHPSFMFLIETLSMKQRMGLIWIKLGYAGLFDMEPVGRSGELALLWKEECDLEIYNFSCQHINTIIKDEDGNHCWKLTGFYGHPVSAKKA
jgi:hypothetical protein